MAIDTPIVLDDELTATNVASLIAEHIERFIHAYAVNQRWFGDKSRSISGVSLVSCDVQQISNTLLGLPIATVEFADGGQADYFLPIAATTDSASSERRLLSVAAKNGSWSFVDAVYVPAFQRWLAESLLPNNPNRSQPMAWSSTSAALHTIPAALEGPFHVSSAQQSNSSIIFGRAMVLKLFRRLAVGINPEIELGRFLTTETNFRNTPQLIGDWIHYGREGPRSLAVAQSYIANEGDGWSSILDQLEHQTPDTRSAVSRLGTITAQLHLALEQGREPEVAPESIDRDDTDHWTHKLVRAISSTAEALRANRAGADGPTQELIDAFLRLEPSLAATAAGFGRLIGRTKTRVHGDFHLGQTLQTLDDDFVILDFEGEPQRTIAERREKTSPLKDVAGMLRSFSYARGAAERSSPESGSDTPSRAAALARWEREARQSFLQGYMDVSRQGHASYVPADEDEVRQALAAWELDKAIYEINYELNNRPDWLEIPLRGTLSLV